MRQRYNKDKLLWIDLEMTGLDLNEHHILEIALILTDSNFNEIDRYQSVISHPQVVLDKMDEIVVEIHTKSGLINRLKQGLSMDLVENQIIGLLKKHCSNIDEEKLIICGNSIHIDREFIKKYMPNLFDFLHYRILDISSFRYIFKAKFNNPYMKDPEKEHFAMDDITSSIEEIKYYLGFIKEKVS